MPTHALLTDMNQVLGRTAGNAVEVQESIDHLTGTAGDSRLLDVTLSLTAELLVLGGVHEDLDGARRAAQQALDTGAAAERFGAMVAALGGPADLVDKANQLLPRAPVVRAVDPRAAGLVTAIDVRAVGIAVVNLGGGRARETDDVDHSVGLTDVAALGERVGAGGRPLALVHARTDASADRAAEALRSAYVIGDAAPAVTDPVVEVQRTV
jgi:thymidine phosphorylase